jgi:hypothetical protein
MAQSFTVSKTANPLTFLAVSRPYYPDGLQHVYWIHIVVTVRVSEIHAVAILKSGEASSWMLFGSPLRAVPDAWQCLHLSIRLS